MVEWRTFHMAQLYIVLCHKSIHRGLDAPRLESDIGLLLVLVIPHLRRYLFASAPDGHGASVGLVQASLSQAFSLGGKDAQGTQCTQLPI